jgi:ABC-type multidrug transport system fused ATPase/permease subunit
VLGWAPAVVLIVLGYVAILHYAYVHHIAPYFTYLQFGYRTPDPFGYAVAIVFVVAIAVLLPRQITRPSHLIVWVLFLIAVLPGLVVPQYAPALSRPAALELALWVGGCFLLVVVLGTRQVLRGFVPLMPLRPRTWWLLIAVLFVVLNGYVVLSIGVNLSLPSFNDVYGVRGDFQTEAEAAPALGYVVPMLDKIINPIMIVRGLFTRRWAWAVAGTLGELYLYAMQGNKTAALAPIALVVAYLFLRRRRPTGATVLLAASIGSVVVMLTDWLLASNDLTSLLIRRVLVLPGLSLAGYVQVFDDIPKAQLGHSVLESFVRSPHQKEPPDLVGAEFFGNPSTHANANWLADGYANFGYPGMLAATVVLILLLWAVDDAARGLSAAFACMLFVVLALSLAESAILTAILTHGFFAMIILCALAPRDWPPNTEGRRLTEHGAAFPGPQLAKLP